MTDDPRMSRRSFLRARVLGDVVGRVGDSIADRINAASDAAGLTPKAPPARSDRYNKPFPVLRPPGAIEETTFLDGCTRCAACIEACPHDAIINAPDRFRVAAGTPMIDPVRQPCRMCEDTPCVTACEPGVLRKDLPVVMGVARISPVTCLAHQNSFCTVCSEHCPVEGAIEIVNGRPRIVEATCTGCGVCQHVCPAPENAILLMPLAHRPAPPASHPDNENDRSDPPHAEPR
ncbi:MAG: 4Fe-4S dicluster domain-containing protein [Phycisphaerales bacterium]|nr:MAG: 4Fe-4S dicluster domain-containing protein [Phycisphaerales bacterium]